MTRPAWAGETVRSALPTTRLSGVRSRCRSAARPCRSQLAIMPRAPAACPALRTRRPYRARPAASSCEPVPWIRRCSTAGSRACQENKRGTQGVAAINLATGEKNCPARPPKGSRAALMPITERGAMRPSRHIRSAIAAPAEWPITSVGARSSSSSKAPRACAMPLSESHCRGGAPSGSALKPWPGRSMLSTSACCASKGAKPRQLWVAEPVP